MMYSKILVPLDGSLLSERALPHAAAISRGTGAGVILLQVVQDPVSVQPEVGQATEASDLDTLTARSLDYLRGVSSRLGFGEGLARTEVRVGNPADAILDFADREKVDVIVMSTHGRSGLSKLVMGSVAEKVASGSRCPIFLIKPEKFLTGEERKAA